jgi:hypothetical protein
LSLSEFNIFDNENESNKKYITVIIIIIFALYILHYFAPNIGFLSPLDKRWHNSGSGVYIDTDDEDYPLQFKEDRYRFVSIEEGYRGKVINWQWIYEVKNISDRPLRINVKYILEDDADFELASSNSSKIIDSGEVGVLRGSSTININDFRRVDGRGWRIGYNETNY